MAKREMTNSDFDHRKDPPPAYGLNDLAVENLMDEFDMTAADVQDPELS